MSTTGSALTDSNNSYSDAFFLFENKIKKILFSSVPVSLFFESTSLDPNYDLSTVFYSLPESAGNIKKEWEACIALKESQTHSFSFSMSYPGRDSIMYTINARAINLSVYPDSSLLFIHGKKSLAQSGGDSFGMTYHDYEKDYAEFIDLAAHDLDAPLRKLSVLIDRVVDKVGGSADLQGYITRIQACLGDMRSMLDNLSTYAGVDADSSEVQTCDLFKMANEITGELKQTVIGKNASINVSPLPIITGNREQLKLLLKELLINALRFSNKKTAPVVEVDTALVSREEKQQNKLSSRKDFIKIIVRDNGIGFDPVNAEKIFRPFVRLNGKSEYPGSGMGLAISRKIAEKHNGIIYAEGHENSGASFTLILPQT